jgi:hypothetical protein
LSPELLFLSLKTRRPPTPFWKKRSRPKLDKLLEKHGYLLAPYEQAEYCLLFTYGLGTPQAVSVAGPDWRIGVGFGTGYWGPGAAYGVYWPGWGPYYTETTVIYDRWLRLTVVEGQPYRATGKATPVWVGEARSRGTSSDLREILNPLLLAAFEQFGKNTRKAVPTRIKQNDPRFTELEGVQ